MDRVLVAGGVCEPLWSLARAATTLANCGQVVSGQRVTLLLTKHPLMENGGMGVWYPSADFSNLTSSTNVATTDKIYFNVFILVIYASKACINMGQSVYYLGPGLDSYNTMKVLKASTLSSPRSSPSPPYWPVWPASYRRLSKSGLLYH